MTDQHIAGVVVFIAAVAVVWFIVKKMQGDSSSKGNSLGGSVNSETGKQVKK